MKSNTYQSISAIALAILIAGAVTIPRNFSDQVLALAPMNSGKGDRLESARWRQVLGTGLALLRGGLPPRQAPSHGAGQARADRHHRSGRGLASPLAGRPVLGCAFESRHHPQ